MQWGGYMSAKTPPCFLFFFLVKFARETDEPTLERCPDRRHILRFLYHEPIPIIPATSIRGEGVQESVSQGRQEAARQR